MIIAQHAYLARVFVHMFSIYKFSLITCKWRTCKNTPHNIIIRDLIINGFANVSIVLHFHFKKLKKEKMDIMMKVSLKMCQDFPIRRWKD
jgi:hypothetical protein